MSQMRISEKPCGILAFEGEDFLYEFNMRKGQFIRISKDGVDMLASMPSFGIWRAPTDNDRNIQSSMRFWYYDKSFEKNYTCRIADATDRYAVISATYAIGAMAMRMPVKYSVLWIIYGDGEISCSVSGERAENVPELPRFGLELTMPAGNDRVRFFGKGPGASYCDMHRFTKDGIYDMAVSEQYSHYIMPQEDGNHCNTRWALVYDENYRGLLIKGVPEFEFSAMNYTPGDLDGARFDTELIPRRETILHIDYRSAGIGSNSCGPELLPKYRISENIFSYSFVIKPVFMEDEDIVRDARTLPAV